MIEQLKQIEKLLGGVRINTSELISNSFNINCIKIRTNSNKSFIVKFYEKKKYKFNSIISETKNLQYFKEKNLNYFPDIIKANEDFLVMEYLINNKNIPDKTNLDFIKTITSIHTISYDKFGFGFNTQIGGDEQINKFEKDWIQFFLNYRLIYIFEKIIKDFEMPEEIILKLESLFKNIHNYLPSNPIPRLLHGDLWEGNILFNNFKINGLIDPGSFYGHNEMELAYLRWFNPKFIDSNFIKKYNEFIEVDKKYFDYEPIYQLYYCLMNVYLWDRSYIKGVGDLLKKIKI